MVYDPAVDPRHIPADDTDLRREYEREEQLDQVNEQLMQVGMLTEMFRRDSWTLMTAQLARERESLQAAADKSYQQGEWHFLRGQIVALDHILSLPRRMDTLQRGLLQQARDLAPDVGGEE